MRSLSSIVHKRDGTMWDEAMFPDLMTVFDRKTDEETKKDDPEEQKRKQEQEEQEERKRTGMDIYEKNVQQAKKILMNAREEASRIKNDAYEAGYVDGMKQGCADGEKKAYEERREELADEYRQLQKKIEDYVEEMEHARERVTEKYLDDLKDISLAIGEKIIQTSLKSSGEVVKNMILAATSKLKKTAWAKIYIADNPEVGTLDIRGDAELLSELAKISDNVKIVVMDDAAPGTCIIELPQEVMDISVSTQMENIKEILNNARV